MRRCGASMHDEALCAGHFFTVFHQHRAVSLHLGVHTCTSSCARRDKSLRLRSRTLWRVPWRRIPACVASRGPDMQHHILPVSPATVHWGYFSKRVAPSLTLRSGDRATIETLTHHANDDHERMIAGDPGAESVFHWTREHKAVSRRGAGPTDRPFGLGSGEGIGVQLLTGPVLIAGPGPGGVLYARILRRRPPPR